MNPKLQEVLKYGLTILLLGGFFLGGGVILKQFLGSDYPMMVVVSQSMVPTLGVGDFIFVGGVEPTKVVASPAPTGDIIVFMRPLRTSEYIVHRAIGRSVDAGSITYTTKGDNNYSQDGWRLPSGNIIGKVVGNIPLLGYFSIFIKTAQGLGFVVGLMLLSYAIDFVLPTKKEAEGRFPIWALAPLLIPPLMVVALWFLKTGDSTHLALETLSLGAWYLSCLLIPLAFHDDDTGGMIWLYLTVLLMVPVACDIVWWTSKITPSNWWNGDTSVIQTNWSLLKTTPAFDMVFNRVLQTVGPGIVINFVVLFAKRRGMEPFTSLNRKLRGSPPPPPPEPESPAIVDIPISQQE